MSSPFNSSSLTPSAPPVTELRPLHSIATSLDTPASEKDFWITKEYHPPPHLLPHVLLHHFAALISSLVVLDENEAFSVQSKDGFFSARRGQTLEEKVVFHTWEGAVKSDFGFGEDLVGQSTCLKLVLDPSTSTLNAARHFIPQKALDSIVCTFQSLLDGESAAECTNPSILNYPPLTRPPAFLQEPDLDTEEGQETFLHTWFDHRAHEKPDNVAIDYLENISTDRKRTTYTYAQIYNASEQLSSTIHDFAYKPDIDSYRRDNKAQAKAGVLIGPSPELYASYLACLKAGVAFCPIPVDAPQERQEMIIEDLDPFLVLVDSKAQKHTGTQVDTVFEKKQVDVSPFLASATRMIEKNSGLKQEQRQHRKEGEDDIAYIMYTSGTTGKPKGVAITHRSVSCSIASHIKNMPAPDSKSIGGKQTRWFQFASPTFDPSIMEIFWTFSTGSTLCAAPRQVSLQDLNQVVKELDVDIMMATPSLASLLDPQQSGLRGLATMGETLNQGVLQAFSAFNPMTSTASSEKPRGIFNAYGPTEAAVNVTLQAHLPSNQRGSVLGAPLDTSSLLVVDPDNPSQPVPMGSIGELLILGPQVSAIGYLNRPEETQKSFIHTPWGRGYRTGDRARIVWDHLNNPVIEYMGRLSDDQIKLSGRRVELGEIDSVFVKNCPGVRESITCLYSPSSSTSSRSSGSEKVVTLISLKNGFVEEEVIQDCHNAAEAHLPSYMRPFSILVLDPLPRSAAGKLDRKASSLYVRKILDARDHAEEAEAETLLPLSDPQARSKEDAILSILTDILNREITASTPLTDAGLDSLSAMRLLQTLKNRYPEDKTLQPPLSRLLDGSHTRQVFFNESFQQQEKHREEATKKILQDFSYRHRDHVVHQLHLPTSEQIDMVLPTTATQSGMITSFVRDPKKYINHSVYLLKQNTNFEKLSNSLQSVVLDQFTYRSRIVAVEDPLAPFAQCVLRKEHAQAHLVRSTSDQRLLNVEQGAEWTHKAENFISLAVQKLYCIQLIQGQDDTGLLVVSLAHCIFDGASLEALMSDVAKVYNDTAPLERGTIYDSVLEYYASLDLETDDYWLKEMQNAQEQEMATLSGNANGPKPRTKFAVSQFQSEITFQDLEKKARELSSSPLSILQACWALLLNCYSESSFSSLTKDVSFGSVVSSHPPQLAHAPMFSTLPCRVQWEDGNTSIKDILQSLSYKATKARAHLHPRLGLFERLPYDTLLALQNYTTPETQQEGELEALLPWSRVSYPAMANDFAFLLEIWPTDPELPGRNKTGKLTFKATYDLAISSDQSSSCLVRQLAGLVQVVMNAKCDEHLSSLPSWLPKDLLSSDSSPSGLHDDLLHSQFEKQAAQTPERLALVFATSLTSSAVEWSYSMLNKKANGLAHTLTKIATSSKLGIVPICLERSVELYVAILAILKAGLAWCPIDTAFPPQRKASLVARTQSRILLTTKASSSCLPPLDGVDVLNIEEHCPTHDQAPDISISPDHLAYLIWTSGTTGEPKGVMISHKAASHAMRILQKDIAHDPSIQIRALQFCAYSFDVFVQDLFYPWGLGGCIIGATRDLILGQFVELVKTLKPTHAHLTPSFGASVPVQELRNSSLRYVTMIGEKLTESVAAAWAEIATHGYNTYGPAENAVVSTIREFKGRKDETRAANVGFAMHGVSAYAMNGEQVTPRYGVGELALGGHQVANGYLGDDEKTSSRFVWNEQVKERLYLTGDMVRLVDAGFEFIGRNDDLVKLSGIRVDLSEISAACMDGGQTVEHVETLLLAPDESSHEESTKAVVSFVAVREKVDRKAAKKATIQRARDKLPSYMLPGYIIMVSPMPRTASAKVDRKALKAIFYNSNVQPIQDDTGENGNYKGSPEWTHEQVEILNMIGELLKTGSTAQLSPHTSLAGAGLNSLTIIKLAWALQKRLSIELSIMELIASESLGQLIEKIQSLRGVKSLTKKELPTEADSLRQVAEIKKKLNSKFGSDNGKVHFISSTPFQESLLVETMRSSGSYWSHRVFQLGPKINFDRLKDAWQTVMNESDILRTSFVPLAELASEYDDDVMAWAKNNGIHATFLQVVHKQLNIRWSSVQNSADFPRQASEEIRMNSNDPPWSVTASREDFKVMLSMHHALHDDYSAQLLLQKVSAQYHGTSNTEAIIPFEEGMDQGLLPSSEKREEARQAWQDKLSVVRDKVGDLHAPFPDCTESRKRQDRKIIRVNRPLQLPESLPVSTSTLIQSAFGVVMAAYLELKGIMLGQTVSQRVMSSKLANVMGPAIVTVPLLVIPHEATSQQVWDSMTQESMRMMGITTSLHPSDLRRISDIGASDPLFTAIYVYHPADLSIVDEGGHNIFSGTEEEMATSLNVEHPFALNVFERQGRVELSGDKSKISVKQLELMLDQIQDIMNVMVSHPSLPVSSLFNKLTTTSTSICIGDNVDESQNDPTFWLTKHAQTHPDWVAVEEVLNEDLETKTLTYAELNIECNTIASKLVDLGLQQDAIVALYAPRDCASIAATLAIFRAGFVYLPIDDELPQARKELLLSDAPAHALITTKAMVKDFQGVTLPDVILLDEKSEKVPMVSFPESPSSLGGFLLYTSGSTGLPKGVRVSRQNLCSFIVAFTNRIVQGSPESGKLGGYGKYLNLAARTFDPHLSQLFSPLRLGMRAVIGNRMQILSNLEEVINTLQITQFGSVPSVLKQMGIVPREVPSVHVVTTGGEKAANDLFDAWEDAKGVMMNFYGPTECTIGCVSSIIDYHTNARNIGFPLQGTQVQVLTDQIDEDGEYVVALKGQPGELCITGDLVAIGYHNRPVEQKKAFVRTKRFGKEEKMYRTGDVMRMMQDGSLEFLGRADQQAKIRGQRLELGEVVAFLQKWSATKKDWPQLDFAAAVIGSNDTQQQLVAFVADKSHATVKQIEIVEQVDEYARTISDELEQECEKNLPAFMVPRLLWISQIPRQTGSMKVDIKILMKLARDVEHDGSDASGDVLNEREIAVVRCIEKVLGKTLPSTNRNKTIFSYGVDSLSTLHLATLLHKEGFHRIRAPDLLAQPSIGAIAKWGSTASSKVTRHSTSEVKDWKDAVDLPSNLSGECEIVLPCLPLQAALISRSLLMADENRADTNHAYVTQFHFTLSASVDIGKWKASVEKVVETESMMRTCFVQRDSDGQIFQVVLRGIHRSVFDGGEDIISAMSTIPPIRVSVDGLSATIKMHHALFDGDAISLLRKKIEDTYKNNTAGDHETSESVHTKLSNYMSLDEEEVQEVKTYWQTQLQGMPPCLTEEFDASPFENKNKYEKPQGRAHIALSIRRLRQQAQELELSLSTIFQVATSLVLASITSKPFVVYGFILSLRPLLTEVEGADNFIGPCLNTLIQPTILRRGESLGDVAEKVKSRYAESLQGSRALMATEKVQQWAGAGDKLFDSVLNINYTSPNSGKIEESLMTLNQGQTKADLSLAFDVTISDNDVALDLSSSGAFTATKLTQLGQLFDRIVSTILEAKHRKIEEFLPNVDFSLQLQHPSHTSANMETEESMSKQERHVRDILCQMLRVDHFNARRSTSLYSLGLDSISVLPFVRQMNKSSGLKLTPGAVLKAKTIQGVAALMNGAEGPRSNASSKTEYEKLLAALGKTLGFETKSLFLPTPIQEGMLMASSEMPLAYRYDHAIEFDVNIKEKDPEFSTFFKAWDALVKCCEILRVRFHKTGDDDVPWIGELTPHVSELLQWHRSEKSDKVLILSIHHALYDGSVIQKIWTLLRAAYVALLENKDITTALHDRYSFLPIAKNISVSQAKSSAHFEKALQGYEYSPMDLQNNSHGQTNSFEVSLEKLSSGSRSMHVTLQTSLLFAWTKVLGEEVYGQRDVVFGHVLTGTACEDHDGGDVVLGPTMNTIALRVTVNDEDVVKTALQHIQAISDEAREHSGASLRHVQRTWRANRTASNTATTLFESLFVFDGIVGAQDRANLWKTVRSDREGPAFDEYPIIVNFRVNEERGTVVAKVRSALSQDEVNLISRKLSDVLETMFDNVEKPALSSLRRLVGRQTKTSASKEYWDKAQEDKILDVAREVLKKRVGREVLDSNTNLSRYGLDSILALRMASLLKRRHGLSISSFAILKGGTVKGIMNQYISESNVTQGKNSEGIVASASRVSSNQRQSALHKLGLLEGEVQSILPLLTGQRMHLEYWVFAGKRFFEAPWFYHLNDQINEATVAQAWEIMCFTHDILRTTFVGIGSDILQVTLRKDVRKGAKMETISSPYSTKNDLVNEFLHTINGTASTLEVPPVRLTLLDGKDGKAICLRIHHALYDAWSIKMIIEDFQLLLSGQKLPPSSSLQATIEQIGSARRTAQEQEYWSDNLNGAQDAILPSLSSSPSPLGPQLLEMYKNIIPSDHLGKVNFGSSTMSANFILAFARVLAQMTGTTRPTFGFYHASRSLGSLDLTEARVPTLTLTPMAVAIDSPIETIQEHLAHLSKYAQAEIGAVAPRFNTYINLMYRDETAHTQSDISGPSVAPTLSRLRRSDESGFDYFRTSKAANVVSTVDGSIDIDHVSPHRIFFDVVVKGNEGVSVGVRCDEGMLDQRDLDAFVERFKLTIEHVFVEE